MNKDADCEKDVASLRNNATFAKASGPPAKAMTALIGNCPGAVSEDLEG